MLVLLLLLVAAASACVDVYPFRLDVGFYWAGIDRSTGKITWTKSCEDDVYSGFDNLRDSVVYFHGLQPDSVKQNVRFFINDTESDDFSRVVSMYLDMDINFGVFEWTQLADEPLTNFIRAEGKINATDFVGETGYVYIDADGELKRADAPLESVTEVAFRHYVKHWPEGSVSPKLIGHSLGTQLVVYLSEMIITSPNTVHPRRVTMLDPVFSDSAKPYLMRNNCGTDISSVLGCYMGHMLERDIPVEMYRSSFINRCIFSSEDNALMVNNSIATALKFTEWGSIRDGYCWNSDLLSHLTPSNIRHLSKQIYEQHRAVVIWYVLSGIVPNPPRICRRKSQNGKDICEPTRTLAPSAAMADSDILKWAKAAMGNTVDTKKACFYQYDDGRSTKNAIPTDDLFFVDTCFKFNT